MVGGGKVAERKAASLLEAHALVVVVAPKAAPRLMLQAENADINLTWMREAYDGTRHLQKVFLVMACTDSKEVNAQVTRDAQAQNTLVLCADNPDAGDFISPTVIRRGPLTLTVSTGGGSPTLAAVLREQLESEYGPEWEALTGLIGQMREFVKTNPTEAGRKAAVRRVLEDPAVRTLLAQGKPLEAEVRARECLSSSSE